MQESRRRSQPGWRRSIVVAALLLCGTWSANSKDETDARPNLLKIIPDGVYANDHDYVYPFYEMVLVGENFPSGDDLKIFVDDRELHAITLEPGEEGPPRKLSSDEAAGLETSESEDVPRAYREKAADQSQVKIWLNRTFYSGRVYIRVGAIASPSPSPAGSPPASGVAASPSPSPAGNPPVSDAAAAATQSRATGAAAPAPSPARILKSKPLPVMLAKIDRGPQQWLFRTVVLLLALFILALPVILVKCSGSKFGVEGGSWLISALFLDRETATYSLSKFQFYVWTAAAAIGYLYLAASRSLVQGVWEFIDIPKNLPGIVFISATTGALARVTTSARGPKGAGDQHPSVADFVSSGGMVSAERVQFFIWTIIGAVVFLWLAIASDPISVHELPAVPQGFLELMGISSFGYLAGKAARKPGPVINSISLNPPRPESGKPVEITARGRILSKEGDFKITYRVATSPGEGEREVDQPLTDGFLKAIAVGETDEQSKPDKTYKRLTLTVDEKNVKAEWFRSGKFVISNPDGQTASWPLPGTLEISDITPVLVPPPTPAPPTGGTSLKLTVTGSNLSRNAIFKVDGEDVAKKEMVADVKTLTPEQEQPDQFAKKIEITISKPNPKWIQPGEHRLRIKNPDDQTVEKTYTLSSPK
jgi:hypothetical protein